MRIERSSSQTLPEFASTNSTKTQLLNDLQSSEYRQAFLDEAIRTRITAQIKTLRDSHEWDYKAFADRLNKKLSWTYRLEDPNAALPTIPTLLQIAAAFDIGLDVRFCSVSDILRDVTSLTPDSFRVPSFSEELRSGAFSRGGRRKTISRHHRRRKLTSKPTTTTNPPISSWGMSRLALAS